MMIQPLLQVQGISKRFGGLQAVSDLSFSLAQGEILGLLGPNGAGKTTAFNMVSGCIAPDQGSVVFDGHVVTGASPAKICKLGVGRTFQISKPFGDLSVLENIMVGGFVRSANRTEIRQKAEEIVYFLGMEDIMDLDSHDVTAFDRRKLELGRALATQPKLLLMDEVVAGATPTEAVEMVELVKRVRDQGISILIVEHVMKVIMGLSDRVIVMDQGKLIANGAPKDVINHSEVLKAYFGEGYVANHA